MNPHFFVWADFGREIDNVGGIPCAYIVHGFRQVRRGPAGEYRGGGPPLNFADLVTGKTDINYAPGWAGMAAIEMIDAAYRSAKSGRREMV